MNIKSLKIVSLLIIFVALITVTSTAFAANNNSNVRPGWGLGDVNHIHTGPPGQSVNPGNSVSQNTNASVTNSISSVSNTGGNRAEGGSVTTGNSNSVVSIATTIGQNILNFLGI